VVHRELRPSKVLLREGRVEDAVLLGFGISSANLAARTVSGSGEIVAALHYLPPEQARGEEQLGASLDIYALGCMLFECLTGKVPFAGDHAAVVLARILYEEAPRLGRLRPELPEKLDKLLARMLAKDPGARVRDGRELLQELAQVTLSPEQAGMVPGPTVAGALVGEGQRLVCMGLAMPRREGGGPAEEGEGGSRRDEKLLEELQREMQVYGAQVEGLADGSVLLMLSRAQGTAGDQAVLAARAVLALRERLVLAATGAEAGKKWSLALATGRGSAAGAQLMGEAMRQTVELLQAQAAQAAVPEAVEGPPVWLNPLAARLLDLRFLVRRVGDGLMLERERTGAEETRLLLGRRTPYVGRTQELGLLEMQLQACMEDSVAQGTLVLGPSGMGKSRLRQEFLRRVEERQEGVEIVIGHGDPMRASGTYGVLGQGLLEWCGLDAVAEDERRQRFAEKVGRHVKADRQQQVVEFLGELCGVEFPDEHSPRLRAARQEPRLMNDQVTGAWIELLRSECAQHAVLLVLEDLHWCDAASVRLVDAALRELTEERFMVVALARPEVKELFPGLWAGRSVQEMWLSALNRRASERLVREMLGERTDEEVARIVEQAGGNALFLEELIRAASEGEESGQPGTVMAMLQARFQRLEPGMRRLLEAASLMGETFWRGGVVALLGMEGKEESEIERWLSALVQTETIVPQKTSRFAGEAQYAFRHALLCDAAYGLLTEEERQAGHRRVGSYLERLGERDLVVLAEHFRRGGDLERAASYFARAAVQAMDANDLAGALRCAERGMACGAAGETLGRLRSVETCAQFWSWNFPAAYAAGAAGLPLLPVGSDAWYRALGPMIALGFQGRREECLERVRMFLTAPFEGAENSWLEASMFVIMQVVLYGERELLGPAMERLREVGARLSDNEARARGLFYMNSIWEPMLVEGDPWPYQVASDASQFWLRAADDRRYAAAMLGHRGFARALLGEDLAAVMADLRTALAELEQLQEATLVVAFQSLLALVLVDAEDPACLAEAEMLAEKTLASSPFPNYWIGLGQVALVEGLAQRGMLPRAEEVARRALAAFDAIPVGRPLGFAVLARILFAQSQGQGQDRLAEARRAAEEGLAALAGLGGRGLLDVRLLLVAAEVFHAAGDPERARAVLADAAGRIERRAAQIPDAAARERFLLGVKDHRRVRQLQEAFAPSAS
jgi:hypothetical protein